MSKLKLPKDYRSPLDVEATEKAIKKLKDYFEVALADELCLQRVTAPVIVQSGTGINDELNGFERPVSFPIKDMDEQRAEVVHSLAKWKRMKLGEMKLAPGRGIYTDMNALRPDEELSNIHSIYVDQWDWEKVISKDDRTEGFLKKTAAQIFSVFKRTEEHVIKEHGLLTKILPDDLMFIHAEELLQRYPGLTPKQREDRITQEYKAVFIIGIGGELSNGEAHDGRAADYDDWSTESSPGCPGLNGDLLFWNPVLEQAFEVSSMGIRVDQKALEKQLKLKGEEEKKSLLFHRMLLDGKLPLTIGGGIGQSRTCMLILQKAHIGEVQSSIWPQEMKESCDVHGIQLL